MKLYKFKSLQDDGLKYALDMIVNERIFLSTCDKMNDPNEGSWRAELPGYLLANISKVDLLKRIIESKRFTCFTDSYTNELLWAHYANGFNGVCFEYRLSESLFDIRKISYTSNPTLTDDIIQKIIDKEIQPQDAGLLKTKSDCWKYESEFRLYQSSEGSEKYINAKPTKIIFGVRNFKWDEILLSIAKKYEIETDFFR